MAANPKSEDFLLGCGILGTVMRPRNNPVAPSPRNMAGMPRRTGLKRGR